MDDVLDAVLLAKLGMGFEMRRLAVDRHERHRLQPVIEPLQLLAPRVAGGVNQPILLRDDLDAPVDEQVLDVDDFALVAGDRPGRKDHPVAGVEIDRRMLAAGDAGDGGARLALAAGA